MGSAQLHDEARFGRLQLVLNERVLGYYNYHPFLPKPYFYPLLGVGGKNLVEDQPADHLHHRGVWYAHHEVNGHDFYLEKGGQGRIRHDRFDHAWHDEHAAGIAAYATWLTKEEQTLLTDVRTIVLRDLAPLDPDAPAPRRAPMRTWALDLTVTLIASEGPLSFTDTKEAGLPLIRVADHLDEKDGGTITIDSGRQGEADTFGQRTAWIDYSGPVAFERNGGPTSLGAKPTEPVEHGIAVFDHPSNPGHPPGVFTRSYGPMSTREGFLFEGPKTLEAGERLTLAHRIFIHPGNVQSGQVAEAYAAYAEETPWTVEY